MDPFPMPDQLQYNTNQGAYQPQEPVEPEPPNSIAKMKKRASDPTGADKYKKVEADYLAKAGVDAGKIGDYQKSQDEYFAKNWAAPDEPTGNFAQMSAGEKAPQMSNADLILGMGAGQQAAPQNPGPGRMPSAPQQPPSPLAANQNYFGVGSLAQQPMGLHDISGLASAAARQAQTNQGDSDEPPAGPSNFVGRNTQTPLMRGLQNMPPEAKAAMLAAHAAPAGDQMRRLGPNEPGAQTTTIGEQQGEEKPAPLPLNVPVIQHQLQGTGNPSSPDFWAAYNARFNLPGASGVSTPALMDLRDRDLDSVLKQMQASNEQTKTGLEGQRNQMMFGPGSNEAIKNMLQFGPGGVETRKVGLAEKSYEDSQKENAKIEDAVRTENAARQSRNQPPMDNAQLREFIGSQRKARELLREKPTTTPARQPSIIDGIVPPPSTGDGKADLDSAIGGERSDAFDSAVTKASGAADALAAYKNKVGAEQAQRDLPHLARYLESKYGKENVLKEINGLGANGHATLTLGDFFSGGQSAASEARRALRGYYASQGVLKPAGFFGGF